MPVEGLVAHERRQGHGQPGAACRGASACTATAQPLPMPKGGDGSAGSKGCRQPPETVAHVLECVREGCSLEAIRKRLHKGGFQNSKGLICCLSSYSLSPAKTHFVDLIY